MPVYVFVCVCVRACVHACVCLEGWEYLCAIRDRLYEMHLGWPDAETRRGMEVVDITEAAECLCLCLPI